MSIDPNVLVMTEGTASNKAMSLVQKQSRELEPLIDAFLERFWVGDPVKFVMPAHIKLTLFLLREIQAMYPPWKVTVGEPAKKDAPPNTIMFDCEW